MSEKPIKTCDYCGAVGHMPTFMNGETTCLKCVSKAPKTLQEANQIMHGLRKDHQSELKQAQREVLERVRQRCEKYDNQIQEISIEQVICEVNKLISEIGITIKQDSNPINK